jgi:hypothetical protein
MPNIFSIARHIDIEVLDRKITAWNNTHDYSPIILMSPDTLADMPKFDDIGIYVSKSTCNNCTGRVGTYEGTKVFSDPSMKYGEVELR